MLKSRINENITCMQCRVNYLCLPRNLSTEEVERINKIISKVKIASKGEHIFHVQDKMNNLLAVYSGACKGYWIDESGSEHIDNFYLPGDIIGLESIPNRESFFSAIALIDTKLCVIPIDPLFSLARESNGLLERIANIASYKMQNDRHIRLTTDANQRIADFILNILYRLQERNVYEGSIALPMSQLDIANFLGMAHETVNRILKKLEQEKIIVIKNKIIDIVNVEHLKKIGTPIHHFGQK